MSHYPPYQRRFCANPYPYACHHLLLATFLSIFIAIIILLEYLELSFLIILFTINRELYNCDEKMESHKKIEDEDRLAQLGYKQELRRDWSLLHNFGVSFAIIVSGWSW